MARRSPFSSDVDPFQRWDPFRGMLDRIFEDLPSEWQKRGLTAPSVDITETDDSYRVRAELAGVSKDDVTVEVENGSLCIRGEKKSERDEKTEKGRRLECSYGSFERSFTLPADASADEISADYKDGVLIVEIAKNPDSKPKQISVKG